MKEYYVYIPASRSRRLYIGMTSDLERRVTEHKTKAIPGFTSQYNVVAAGSVLAAIPTAIVFFAFQKQFVSGLLVGSNK